MKAKLYVRAARHQRYRRGYRVDTSLTHNPDPLTVGVGYAEESVHTVHFVLNVHIPDELLRPAALPQVDVIIDADLTTVVAPVVEQLEPVQ